MADKRSFIPGVAGVILAGGRSKRFGRNKALADLAGKPLIEYVATTLGTLFSSCLLATSDPEPYSFLGLPVTADRHENCGPLGGIHSALLTISEPRAFIVGCDMPLLAPELIRFLCELERESTRWDAVIPWLILGPEPLCGVYHKSALPAIEAQIRNKEKQLGRLLKKIRLRAVSEGEILRVVPDLRSLHNVNQPADLEAIGKKQLKG